MDSWPPSALPAVLRPVVSEGLILGSLFFPRLQQFRIRPIHANHGVVSSALHNAAFLHHNNFVAIANRAQTMRDDQQSAAPAAQIVIY